MCAGVIPLEYYTVRKKQMPKGKKKYSMLLQLAFEGFKSLTECYKLQADTESSLETWVDRISKKVRPPALSLERISRYPSFLSSSSEVY